MPFMDDDNRKLSAQPLLLSVQSLVAKERQLAQLLIEEKEKEAREWRARCLELEAELIGEEPRQEPPPVPFQGPSSLYDGFASTHGEQQPVSNDELHSSRTYTTLLEARREPGNAALAALARSTTLDLSREGMSAARLAGAAVKISWIKGLTFLDLSRNSLDDSCAREIAKFLETRLVRLDLSHNDLGAAAVEALLGRLRRDGTLNFLHLHGNMHLAAVPTAGAAAVAALTRAAAAGRCRQLHALSITVSDYEDRFRPLGPVSASAAAAAATAAALQQRPRQPTTATVATATAPPAGRRRGGGGAKKTPMNALALVRLLGQREPAQLPLQSLWLRHARLHPKTLAELALRAPVSLTELDLSDCFIGAAGTAALAKGLGATTRRGGAMMAQAPGVAAGAGALGAAANWGGGGGGNQPVGQGAAMVTLASLRLRQNAVGGAGAAALARALRVNRSLTLLDVRSNYVGDAGAVALATAAARNPVLAFLDLRENAIGDNAREKIAGALKARQQKNPLRVRGVELLGGSGNGIGGGGGGSHFAYAKKDGGGGNSGSGSGKSGSGGASVEAGPLLAAADDEITVLATCANGEGFVEMHCATLDVLSEPPGGRGLVSVRWLATRLAPGAAARRPVVPYGPVAAGEGEPRFRWRISRRRDGGPLTTVREGISDQGTPAGGAAAAAAGGRDGDPPERLGFRGFRVVAAGWRAGDELSLWLCPCDGRGNAILPSQRGRAGQLCCRELRVFAGGEGHNLLYADIDAFGTGSDDDKDYYDTNDSRGATATGGGGGGDAFAEDDAAAADAWSQIAALVPAPPCGAAGGRLVHLRQVFVATSGTVQAAWEARLEARCADRVGNVPVQRFVAGYTWVLARRRPGLPVTVVASGTCRPSVAGIAAVGAGGGGSGTGRDVIGAAGGSGGGGFCGGGRTSSGDGGGIISPWKWSTAEAAAVSCLSGDVLSLWARADLRSGVASYNEAQRVAVLEGVGATARRFRLFAADGVGDGGGGSNGNGGSSIGAAAREVVRLDFWGPHCMNHAAAGGTWSRAA